MKKSLFIMVCVLLAVNSCEKDESAYNDPIEAGKWTLLNSTNGFKGSQVLNIKSDSRSDLWFAVDGYGAARFSGNTWSYFNTSNSAILSNNITCIEEASDGTLFFGTANGFSMLSSGKDWSSYRYPGVIMDITVIKSMKDKTIWIGTKSTGLFIIEGNTITQIDLSLMGWINDLEEDNKGNIWIATDSGLIKFDGNTISVLTTADGLPDDIVTSLHFDSKERLWIGTYFGKTASWMQGRTIMQLSLQNGNSVSEINDIFEDRAGNVWFATWGSGLLRYDGVITQAFKKYNGFPEDDVLSIGEDNSGHLWFGLYSKGLVRYTLPLD